MPPITTDSNNMSGELLFPIELDTATSSSGFVDSITNLIPNPISNIVHSLTELFSVSEYSFSAPLILVVSLWILILIRVAKDSSYRSHSNAFVVFSLILVTICTPIIGLPIYRAIRPIGYKYEREYWKLLMTQLQEANVLIPTETERDDQAHLASLQDHVAASQERRQLTRIKNSVSKSAKRDTKENKTTKKSTKTSTTKKVITPQKRPTPQRVSE